MEKELKALSESSATKEDISRVRAEMKKLYDGLHVGECASAMTTCFVEFNEIAQNSSTCGRTFGASVSAYFSC